MPSLIKDHDSGIKIANYYRGEIYRMYNKAINELKRILATPQAANDNASVFKSEDCNNDVNSPNEPPAGGASATAAAAAPGGTQPPAQYNPVCDKAVTYSLADTQAIYSQLNAVAVNPGADPTRIAGPIPLEVVIYYKHLVEPSLARALDQCRDGVCSDHTSGVVV